MVGPMDAAGPLSQFAVIVGLLAGSIAVSGFLGHAGPALAGRREDELRRATVVGGLWGLAIATTVIVLSVVVW